jgi:rhomboid family GlyGly-CTERM serine protease
MALLVAFMVLCQVLPEPLQGYLPYERSLCRDGQVWRLLTAGVIHLGWSHLVLNAAGLLLVTAVFGRDWPVGRWLLALGISAVVSTLGVHLASPEVYWLKGLSGALHGLFAFGAVGWLRLGDRMGWVLLGGLLAKLLYEQWVGAMALTEGFVGGPVIVAAHVWGSVGGLLAAAIDRLGFRQDPAPL